MASKIFRYSISAWLALCLAAPLSAQGVSASRNTDRSKLPVARKTPKEKKEPQVTYPLWGGLSLGIDLLGGANRLLGSDFLSSEVQVSADLYHRYLPTVEVGFGGTDAWNDHGTNYRSKAPYFRIGADYNFFAKKAHGNMLLAGLRYGFSSFKYDVEALGIDDPVYGGSVGNPELDDDVWGGASLPYRYTGMKGNMHWAEICLAIRGRITKHIDMSLGLRYKVKISASTDEHAQPWYVPGFGKYGANTLGVAYHIIYKF